ncbi:MAG TPA: glycosyltransferase family 4 protein [Anaerolineae bacterium]
MRVLMIAPTSFFSDYGGHIRIFEEIRILQKLGHQICVVTYPLGGNPEGIDVRRAKKLPYHTNYEVGSSRHKFAFDVLLTFKALTTALAYHPHIIHAHMHEGTLIGSALSRLLRVPLVFDFQGSLTAEMIDHHFLDPRGKFHRPLGVLEKWIDHQPARILTSSQNAVRGLIDQFGVAADKIVPIPDCVDTERWHPLPPDGTQLREYLGIPRTRQVVVYLGLLADYQGTRVLIEAAEKLTRRGADVHFLIMGFPGVNVYADYARKLGVAHRVSFPGKIPYEQAQQWLALGDVAVAPKMSLTEGNGKILNYMAMGLPVVAFEHPVAREYLGNLGVYVPLGDANGLADALESTLNDRARASELGRALRARVIEKFSWDAMGREIEQVYMALVPSPGTTVKIEPKFEHLQK